ncbi:hypothetical protein ACA910_017074 [Epithemia clementina (nom. ined.)]
MNDMMDLDKPHKTETRVDETGASYSRDELLQVAEYLNTFQSFYLKEGQSLGTIRLIDLQKICSHHDRQQLEHDDKNNDPNDDQKDEGHKDLDARLKCVDRLWSRVTVWNFKALAQQLLITPPSVSQKFKVASKAKQQHRKRNNNEDDDDDDESFANEDSHANNNNAESSGEEDEDHGSNSPQQQPPPLKLSQRSKSAGSSGDNHTDVDGAYKTHSYFSALLGLPLSSWTRETLPLLKATAANPPTDHLTPFARIFDELYNQDQDNNESNPDSTAFRTGGGHDDDNANNNNTDDMKSVCLSLPPNHYTWPFYAAITDLLLRLPSSILPSVYTSPFLGNLQMGSGLTLRPARPLPRALSHATNTRKFLKADLVALFVRAQRNLEAKRHFLQLFEYVPLKNDGNHGDVGGEGEGPTKQQEKETPRMKAIFRGNHKMLYTRSIRTSSGLMRLQSWAIINQVLFTAPAVYTFIKEKYFNGCLDGRPPPPPEYRSSVLERQKRMRRDNSQETTHQQQEQQQKQDAGGEWLSTALTRSVHAALLRSWARRYQRLLEPLFYSSSDYILALSRLGLFPLRSDHYNSDYDEERSDALWTEESVNFLLPTVKAKLSTSDRNLVRIDRRIPLGKYDNPGVFEEIIKQVLDAFVAAATEYGNPEMKVHQTATCLREDLLKPLHAFETMKEEVGALRAASEFLEKDENNSTGDESITSSDEYVKKVFDSVPAPWISRCCKCERNLIEEKTPVQKGGGSPIRTCASCQNSYHVECGAQPVVLSKNGAGEGDNECEEFRPKTNRLKSYIDAFPPLQEMFTIRIPKSGPIKDFIAADHPDGVIVPNYADDSMIDQIQFTEKIFRIKREMIESDGKRILRPYGMGLGHITLYNQTMQSLVGGKQRVWELQALGGRLPLSVRDKDGFLIYKIVSTHAAESAGLEKNDIITAIEFISFHSDEEDTKFSSQQNKRIQIANVPLDERFNLFKANATEIIIVVQRPSQPIFDQAQALTSYLLKKYRIERRIVRNKDILWFCANCCKRQSPNTLSSPRWQARCCRALIRYLGTQWYGRNIWFEELTIDELKNAAEQPIFHSKCVSLARLDLMMDGILNKFGYFDSHEASAYYGFMVSSERLGWAPEAMEKDPLSLMCKGVQLLSNIIDDDAVKEGFLTDFSTLFCSWCLSSSHSNKDMATDGPYLYALHVKRPFDSYQLCQRCLLREIPERKPPHCCSICDEMGRLRKQGTDGESTLETTNAVAQAMRSYEERASFVGKVVHLLPTDTRTSKLTSEMKKFNIFIEHHDRPLELLVASYLPRNLCPTDEEADLQVGGVYHLLPLVNYEQVGFLVSQSKPRKTVQILSAEAMDRWSVDGLLDLGGVLQMPFDEVSALVALTNTLFDAAKSEVFRQVECICAPLVLPAGDSSGSDAERLNPVICTNSECSTLQGYARKLGHCRSTTDKLLALDGMSFSHNSIFSELLRRKGLFVADPTSTPQHEAQGHIYPAQGKKDFEPRAFLVPHAATKNRNCKLTYNDLFFSTTGERDIFVGCNHVSTESAPSHHSSTSVISMSRKPNIDWPELGGWGMEVYRWKKEGKNILTVGRINPSGAAFKSGLRSGDRIVELNGLRVDFLDSSVTLSCALLGIPFLVDDSYSRKDHMVAYLLRLSAIQGLETCVLQAKIQRVFKETKKPQPQISSSSRPQSLSLPPPRGSVHQKVSSANKDVIDLSSDPGEDTTQDAASVIPGEKDMLFRSFGNKFTLTRKLHILYQEIFKSIAKYAKQQNATPVSLTHSTYEYVAKIGKILIATNSSSGTTFWRQATKAEGYNALYDIVNQISITKGDVMLGLRLLVPRYDVDFVVDQVKVLSQVDAGNVKILPYQAWEMFQRVDFHRSQLEPPDAPNFFYETRRGYRYRFPIVRCPIDRLLEDYLDARATAQPFTDIINGFADKVARDVFRVRGGGPEFIQKGLQSLAELPKSSWDKKLVSGRAKIASNSGKEEITYLGRVVFPLEESGKERQKVTVNVVHMSHVGGIDQTSTEADPKKLFLVELGSDDEKKILCAEAMQQGNQAPPAAAVSNLPTGLHSSGNSVSALHKESHDNAMKSRGSDSYQLQDKEAADAKAISAGGNSESAHFDPLQDQDTRVVVASTRSFLEGNHKKIDEGLEAGKDMNLGLSSDSTKAQNTQTSTCDLVPVVDPDNNRPTSVNIFNNGFTAKQLSDQKPGALNPEPEPPTRQEGQHTGQRDPVISIEEAADGPREQDISHFHDGSQPTSVVPHTRQSRSVNDLVQHRDRVLTSGEGRATLLSAEADQAVDLDPKETHVAPDQTAEMDPNVSRQYTAVDPDAKRNQHKQLQQESVDVKERALDGANSNPVDVDRNQSQLVRPKPGHNDARPLLCTLFGADIPETVSTGLIGCLPDSRNIYWFASDPDALYVDQFPAQGAWILGLRSSEFQLHLSSLFNTECKTKILPPEREYLCVWGCCRAGTNSTALGFTSREELLEHTQKYHSFGEVNVDGTAKPAVFMRIMGDSVLKLLEGLTKSTISLCPRLDRFAVSSNDGSSLFARSLLFSAAGKQEISSQYKNLPHRFKTLLPLVCRILSLFPLTSVIGPDEQPPPSQADPNFDILQQEIQTCNMGCEPVFATERDLHRDLGCNPFGSMAYGESLRLCDGNHDNMFDAARTLIVEMVSAFPDALIASHNSSLPNFGGENREKWLMVLREASCIDTLLQVLAVFVSVLDKTKVPEWWKAEGQGWSVFQLFLSRVSWSSFFMELSVLDLCISESIAVAASEPIPILKGDHCPEALKGLSYDEKVLITLDRAKTLKVPLWEGEYRSECSICLDGGELLCCELCSNTAHQACYKLVLSPDRFVCYSCIDDIDALAED